MKKIIVLPDAEKDIKETVKFYNENSEELEERFKLSLDFSFTQILQSPKLYPYVKFDIRKFVIKKFPFSIFYIDRKDAIYILAVFHDKRNPKEWKKRKV